MTKKTILDLYHRIVEFAKSYAISSRMFSFNEVKVFFKHQYASSEFYFVQIGANDGRYRDPIHLLVRRYRWRGLLIEPIARYFEDLKRNYKGFNNLKFENVAIADYNGTLLLHRVSHGAKWIARWYRGLASVERSHVLKHAEAFSGLNRNIVEENVSCITLSSLMERHQVSKVNLLVLDVEGYEKYILQQLVDLTIIPDVVYYEYRHLTPADRVFCHNLLADLGYNISYKYEDAIAFKCKKAM